MLRLGRRVSVACGALAIAAAITPPAFGAPPPTPTVYFVGDSVTAGFGYCGTESVNIPGCATNAAFANNWTGANSIKGCKPPEPVDDRCSNNNDSGKPWDAGPWKPGPGAPTISYPYVIARTQSSASAAHVEDWAMTGSTPADWDPAGGQFAAELGRIKNSFVVMTLGANPLLSDYLRIDVANIPFEDGKCSQTVVLRSLKWYALDPREGPNSVLECFNAEWTKLKQGEHLEAVYKALLQAGNKLLVIGYPPGCPWSFGNWQPNANVAKGPADGYSCKTRVYPNIDNGNEKVTQWQQARALGSRLDSRIAAAVASARRYGPISFVAPSSEWESHQAWDPVSWFFKNDTWIHPDPAGHEQLASTAIAAMCRVYKHWCGKPPRWTAAPRRRHRRSARRSG
jgi:hypothetical protein